MLVIDGVYRHPMEKTYGYFCSKRFLFPEEILTRYAISLMTKPFAILSGISGTGKTKIAQIFADYILSISAAY
jgi:5-methylcytosine-specific restriction enzyme B